jgi:hypothetical protein
VNEASPHFSPLQGARAKGRAKIRRTG